MASIISNMESVRHDQPVNIIIDPRTCDLDKTIRDVLQISELVANEMPSVRIESITVKGYSAAVKAIDLSKSDFNETTLRLYCINGDWKMRNLGVGMIGSKQNSRNKPRKII